MSILAQIFHRFQSLKANNPSDDVSVSQWNDSHPITTAAVNGSALIIDSVHPDGLGASAPLLGVHELGGSTLVGVKSSSFVQVPEFKHPFIDPTGWVTAQARVERQTKNPSTSVQVQIVDTDAANAVVGTGVIYNTDANWNEEVILLTLNALPHHYELQVQGSDEVNDVLAQGVIELYAV